MSDEIHERLNQLQEEHIREQHMAEMELSSELEITEQSADELEAARERVALAQEGLRLLEKDNTEKETKRKRTLLQLNMLGSGIPGEVIPNMPCPCGSGKKYKDCHGSINR